MKILLLQDIKNGTYCDLKFICTIDIKFDVYEQIESKISEFDCFKLANYNSINLNKDYVLSTIKKNIKYMNFDEKFCEDRIYKYENIWYYIVNIEDIRMSHLKKDYRNYIINNIEK